MGEVQRGMDDGTQAGTAARRTIGRCYAGPAGGSNGSRDRAGIPAQAA